MGVAPRDYSAITTKSRESCVGSNNVRDVGPSQGDLETLHPCEIGMSENGNIPDGNFNGKIMIIQWRGTVFSDEPISQNRFVFSMV